MQLPFCDGQSGAGKSSVSPYRNHPEYSGSNPTNPCAEHRVCCAQYLHPFTNAYSGARRQGTTCNLGEHARTSTSTDTLLNCNLLDCESAIRLGLSACAARVRARVRLDHSRRARWGAAIKIPWIWLQMEARSLRFSLPEDSRSHNRRKNGRRLLARKKRVSVMMHVPASTIFGLLTTSRVAVPLHTLLQPWQAACTEWPFPG